MQPPGEVLESSLGVGFGELGQQEGGLQTANTMTFRDVNLPMQITPVLINTNVPILPRVNATWEKHDFEIKSKIFKAMWFFPS